MLSLFPASLTTPTDPSIDKSSWPPGPWHYEPDRSTFTAHGLSCAILRPSSGHLCGYVKVPKEKSWRRVGGLSVHGSVTWDKVEDNGEHWIGFDCNHSYDYAPAPDSSSRWNKVHSYRTIKYVTDECLSLAKQIVETQPDFSFSHSYHITGEGLQALKAFYANSGDYDGKVFASFLLSHVRG